MSKYSFEFKKKVVFEYLHENIGSTSLAVTDFMSCHQTAHTNCRQIA